MTAALVLAIGALILGFVALAELFPRRSRRGEPVPVTADASPTAWALLATADGRLGLSARLARAGLSDRISPEALLAAKLGGAVAGLLWAMVVAPAAPSRLAWIVAVGFPAAGFLGPDAWLERRARQRLRALRAGLPDALDLLAVGTAAGRSPLAGLSELGRGETSR